MAVSSARIQNKPSAPPNSPPRSQIHASTRTCERSFLTRSLSLSLAQEASVMPHVVMGTNAPSHHEISLKRHPVTPHFVIRTLFFETLSLAQEPSVTPYFATVRTLLLATPSRSRGTSHAALRHGARHKHLWCRQALSLKRHQSRRTSSRVRTYERSFSTRPVAQEAPITPHFVTGTNAPSQHSFPIAQQAPVTPHVATGTNAPSHHGLYRHGYERSFSSRSLAQEAPVTPHFRHGELARS